MKHLGKRIAVTVKTVEGGLWILPQIEEIRRNGAEVVVILPEGRGRLARATEELAQVDPGVTFVRSPFDFSFKPGLRLLRGLLALRALFIELRIDSVLYHLYATALAVRIATIGRRIRRVHMVAGPLYLESRVIRIFERILCRLDTVIVCGSEYTADRYRRIGCPEGRLVVIPYGVDTARFSPGTPGQAAASRAELALGSDDFVVIMIAYVYAPKRLVFNGKGIKGHEDLLEAWGKFHGGHPEAKLVLVGGGFDSAGELYRQRLIGKFPDGLKVRGINWIASVDDVRAAYDAADVSISPSLSENHGAALEASSMGKPCIVSDAGALPETVDSTTGWVHSAGSPESILRALEAAWAAARSGRLSEMGAQARIRMCERFDQAVSARKVAEVVLVPLPACTGRSS